MLFLAFVVKLYQNIAVAVVSCVSIIKNALRVHLVDAFPYFYKLFVVAHNFRPLLVFNDVLIFTAVIREHRNFLVAVVKVYPFNRFNPRTPANFFTNQNMI
jgi:hypothetical protein